MTEIIYKILTPQEWSSFQKDRVFKGSPMDQKDGFIHAALADQYPRLVEKFFKDIRPLVILKINTTFLKPGSLKIESNRPGGDEYPHIYGDIPLEAIISHEILEN